MSIELPVSVPTVEEFEAMPVGTRVHYTTASRPWGRTRVKRDTTWVIDGEGGNREYGSGSDYLRDTLLIGGNVLQWIDRPGHAEPTAAVQGGVHGIDRREILAAAALIRTLTIEATDTEQRFAASGAHPDVIAGLAAKRAAIAAAAAWLESQATNDRRNA